MRILRSISCRTLLFISFCLINSNLAISDSEKMQIRRHSRAISGQYIVILKDPSQTSRMSASATEMAAALSAQYSGNVKQVFQHASRGFVVQMDESHAQRLAGDESVEFVEEDAIVKASFSENASSWGLDRVDQRDLPLNKGYNYDYRGDGVSVYVIDTGIRVTHQEFGGRAVVGFDAVQDGKNGIDCAGHGTHVAATVGGTTYGIAKKTKLYSVRVLDCTGSGTTSGVIAGVDWVTAHHQGPSVANMSLGGGLSDALDRAVQNSIKSGVIYAIAAGNENEDACNSSPSRVPEAITVGATNQQDQKANYSNFGSCVDIFAPGTEIKSAWIDSDQAVKTISGTSMATPHVTGVVALYLQEHPSASPSEVAAVLKTTATPQKIASLDTQSPNLLLYTYFKEDDGSDSPCPNCTLYAGSLTASVRTKFEPKGGYYYSSHSGQHLGFLKGQPNTDFDLYLKKWNGSSWVTVAKSTSETSNESISYFGSPGYFTWGVYSYKGVGSYQVWLLAP